MKGFILLLFSFSIFTFSAPGNIQNLSWNGVDVVWLESDKLPKFDIVVYFSDGALADSKNKEGETSAMFSLLSNGTNKYSQKDLSDKFDFYGSGIGSSVTHEYSTLSYSGLAKDARVLSEMFCHVIKNASYPKTEIDSFKKKASSQLKNLIANHGSLANRILRKVSLAGTPFNTYANGSIKSINKLSRTDLLRKRNYFNDNVYKKIFISGPKDVLSIEKIFKRDCNWSNAAKFKRKDQKIALPTPISKKKGDKLDLVFVPVKGANQAQVRLGNFVPVKSFEGSKLDLTKLSSSILGGGFTSLLMQELRVKRGLTYGAYSYAAPQYLYGRSVLQTSTKNKTLVEMLYTIRDTLKFMNSGSLPEERVAGVKKFLKGKHLLKFESNSSYISNLVLFDHLNRSYSDLVNFGKTIDTFSKEQVIAQSKDLFTWDNQVILVLGAPSLRSTLAKTNYFNIREVSVNDFL